MTIKIQWCVTFFTSLSHSLVPWASVSTFNMDLVLGFSREKEPKLYKRRFIMKNGSQNYNGWEVSQSAFVSWRLGKASGMNQSKSKGLRNRGAGDIYFIKGQEKIEWGHPYWGEWSALMSSTIQMLISSRNILKIYPEIMLNQICGHHMIQASWHIKLTVTDALSHCDFFSPTISYNKVNHKSWFAVLLYACCLSLIISKIFFNPKIIPVWIIQGLKFKFMNSP